MNLVDLLTAVKGSPLDEAERRLVHAVSCVLVQEGQALVGRTVLAGLDDDPDVAYHLGDETFMTWLRKHKLFDESVLEPLEPTETRIVILFPNGHAFVKNLMRVDMLN